MPEPSLNEIGLTVEASEVEAVLSPYLGREIAADAPEWLEHRRRLARKWKRQRRRRDWLGWLPRVRHDQHNVARVYARTWTELGVVNKILPTAFDTPAVWGERSMLVDGQGTKRVHMLYLMRLIALLRPRRVLEVGCGNGLNLILLANRFPEVAFTGIELTPEGVAAAQSGIAMAELPRELVDFAPDDLPSRVAHARIEVRQGSAAELPFEDNSFDLVFTVLALEQMEEIRDQALAEIARIAGRHTVMIEPFRDWNESGLRRDGIVARDYFQARVADLADFGLMPVYVSGNIPSKLQMGVGIVAARKSVSGER